MSSDSEAVVATPEAADYGPRPTADLQILSCLQQVMVQQQLVDARMVEMHKSLQTQMTDIQAQMQAQQMAQAQLHMQQAAQAQLLAQMQTQVQLLAAQVQLKQLEVQCQAAPLAQETEVASASQGKEVWLRRPQRPGSRARRRMRAKAMGPLEVASSGESAGWVAGHSSLPREQLVHFEEDAHATDGESDVQPIAFKSSLGQTSDSAHGEHRQLVPPAVSVHRCEQEVIFVLKEQQLESGLFAASVQEAKSNRHPTPCPEQRSGWQLIDGRWNQMVSAAIPMPGTNRACRDSTAEDTVLKSSSVLGSEEATGVFCPISISEQAASAIAIATSNEHVAQPVRDLMSSDEDENLAVISSPQQQKHTSPISTGAEESVHHSEHARLPGLATPALVHAIEDDEVAAKVRMEGSHMCQVQRFASDELAAATEDVDIMAAKAQMELTGERQVLTQLEEPEAPVTKSSTASSEIVAVPGELEGAVRVLKEGARTEQVLLANETNAAANGLEALTDEAGAMARKPVLEFVDLTLDDSDLEAEGSEREVESSEWMRVMASKQAAGNECAVPIKQCRIILNPGCEALIQSVQNHIELYTLEGSQYICIMYTHLNFLFPSRGPGSIVFLQHMIHVCALFARDPMLFHTVSVEVARLVSRSSSFAPSSVS